VVTRPRKEASCGRGWRRVFHIDQVGRASAQNHDRRPIDLSFERTQVSVPDPHDPEFRALLRLSAELGRNPLRTQAAGGNTSLKREGTMWIKASGMWLAEAMDRDVMVPVMLGPLREALAAGDPRAETGIDFVAAGAGPSGLRPSVETPVHAVVPWPVVVHIHDVGAIAVSVRADAESAMMERLRAVPNARPAFVSYVRPGVPLSRAIAALPTEVNAFVLGNHGLVVSGATVAEAGDLLARVSAALDEPRRNGGDADIAGLTRLAEGSPYRLPQDTVAHDVATDAESLAIARRGTLYPDHVVFLGPGIVVLGPGDTPAAVARRAETAGVEPPPALVVPRHCVLIHRLARHGADELARGLAEVTGRIAPRAELNVLTPEQEGELVDWDAEKYRLSLAGGTTRPPLGQRGSK
jgi:rhamnose utilization protein RhaD (predicted bifunctional aldolase and dehydrogenase)